jgi:hypothetical protein
MKEFGIKNDIEWVQKENSSLLLQKLLTKLVKEGIGKGEK